MKVNHKLMIISMVIISFLAVGAVSASENVTNDLETADFHETITVDDNLNDAVAADDESEKISSPQSEVVVAAANGTDVIPDISFKNRYDWSTLYNKNASDDSLLIVDISNAFGGNKTGSSFFAFDKNNFKNGSYMVVGLSSLLRGNANYDSSYLAFDISCYLGANKTDDSFLVLDLPSLGISSFGNSSSLIVDLTNLMSKNRSSAGSFISIMFGNTPLNLDLSSIYVNDTLLGVNLPLLFSENFTERASFLEDFEWGLIFGMDSTNLNSFFNDLNGTGIFEGNLTSLTDRLNLSDVASLLNMTSLTDTINLTSVLGNISLSEMLKFNVTEFIGSLNVTDLFDDFNASSLLKGVNMTALVDNVTSVLKGVNMTALVDNVASVLNGVNLTGLADNVTSVLKGVNMTALVDNVTSVLESVNLTGLADNVADGLNNASNSLKNVTLTTLFDTANKLFDTMQNLTEKAANLRNQINNLTVLFDNVNSLLKNVTLNGIVEKYIANNSIIKNMIDRISSNSTAPVEVPADSIKSANLKTYYAAKTKYSVTVMSGNNTVTSGKVVFTVNNKQYTANINSNGVATLNVKLKPGTYYITSKYNDVLVQKKIVVKKSIITKNVSKKVKKTGKFTVKVLNTKGKAHAKQTVKIKLKGKTYKAKTNSKGIATFKLPKTLKVGKYTIKTTCKGLTVSNKLTVKR